MSDVQQKLDGIHQLSDIVDRVLDDLAEAQEYLLTGEDIEACPENVAEEIEGYNVDIQLKLDRAERELEDVGSVVSRLKKVLEKVAQEGT